MKDPAPRELSDLHVEYLGVLCSMDRMGADIAVPAALHYCAKHNVSPPEWLVKRASDLLCSLLNPSTHKKLGRSGGIVERYRQDTIDHIRFEAIDDFRRQRALCEQQIEELVRIEGPAAKKMLADLELKRLTLGNTDQDLFDLASANLRGAAGGGREAMKKAYQRFRSVQDDSYRYHVLDPQFLRA